MRAAKGANCPMRRYRAAEEMREKLTTAITIGQGYMALS
jgi:hypothetical protein